MRQIPAPVPPEVAVELTAEGLANALLVGDVAGGQLG
ncbi:hypothetical protein BH24ACT14_BH24ACT14_14270 [soil metagenome]|jgi:hypothetical protein